MHRRCNGVKLDTPKEPAYGVYYIAWQIVIRDEKANIASVIRFIFLSSSDYSI